MSSQKNRVLKMLADGRTVSKLTTITMGIGNLNDVIMKLRRDGHSIATVTDRDGNGQQFTKYEIAA